MEKPVFIERVQKIGYTWKSKYLCSCGNEFVAFEGNVKRGYTKSCGCYNITVLSNRASNPGLAKKSKKLHKVWTLMRARCANSHNNRYYLYGGRGIKVCEEWQSYPNFYNWAMANGYKEGLSIERTDNDKNYCPENCTWIPRNEQSRNRRCSLGVEKVRVIKQRLAEGEKCAALARDYNVKHCTISAIKNGIYYKDV